MKANPQQDALAIAAAAKRIAGEALIAEADKIDKQLAASRRPEPSAIQTMWSLRVTFTPGGKEYMFLILRVGGRYFTTGTGESGMFPSWAALLRWLDANVAWHSNMLQLRVVNGTTPALKAAGDDGQVPF